MEDDARDELLIRLDERTRTTGDDVKELKLDLKVETAATHQRLDIIETTLKTHPAVQAAAPKETGAGRWAGLLEVVAAIPAAWHIIGGILLSSVGTLALVFTWLAKHGEAIGVGK